MSQLAATRNFKGLLPPIDRRRVAEPYIVEGMNFLMSVDGPFSGLGRSLLAYHAFHDGLNVQNFQIAEDQESYVATNEGIFKYSSTTEHLQLVYELSTVVTTEFPWSLAAVGNKYYFARKGYNLIEYDLVNDVWSEPSGGSIPANIYACEESEGRLILLTNAVVSWSAIGDGQNHTPSTTTGAGSQALTKLGVLNPTPLGVVKVPDGFLTFLSSGIMKSQAINSTNPFRHITLSQEHKPINPYCITLIEKQSVIILTVAGFFEIELGLPKPWQPLMSEHLRTNVIPQLDTLNNQNNLRLDYSFDKAWFVLSISTNQQDYLYNLGYILDLHVDEWSSLNDPYRAVSSFEIIKNGKKSFIFCLYDLEGSIYNLDSSIGIEKIPTISDGLYYHENHEDFAARKNATETIFVCQAEFRNVATVAMSTIGLYDRYAEENSHISPVLPTFHDETAELDSIYLFKLSGNSEIGLVRISIILQARNFDALNSYVIVGLFGLSDEETVDRQSYAINVEIGMNEDAVSTTFDDWASTALYPIDVFEDWLLLDGEEDWGGDPVLSVNYTPTIESSYDGYERTVEQNEILTEENSVGRTKLFSCDSTGVFHAIKISALEKEENFYLKTIKLSANFGGRF